MNPRPRFLRTDFTLVELLVVIAVIANAHTAKCAANFQQLGVGSAAYAAIGRIALASCQFAYSPRNAKLPLSFHNGAHPVLFSDGSVQIIGFPKGAVDPENPPNIWDSNTKQISIWRYFAGKTTALNL